MIEPKEIKSGFDYFITGWHLITRPGLRRFVIMPILLNIVLMIGLFWRREIGRASCRERV